MQTLLTILSVASVVLFALVVLQFVYYRKHCSEKFTTPTTDIGTFAHPGNTRDDVLKKMMYRQI